jgi:DNA processing protein
MLNEWSGYTYTELKQADSAYPQKLLDLPNAPEVLHCVGEVAALSIPAIAIIGARKATVYGLNCANRFAKIAAQNGISVVSGGAIGCDQSAHRGCLSGHMPTTVVLGCGADVVYPKRAKLLFEDVLEHGGVIVSEAPWSSPVSRWGFRNRNRIIAALAHAVLIVEAGLPSGTFITADEALTLGRDVLCVPGCITSKESAGSNQLLLQGAIPIINEQSFEDTLRTTYALSNELNYRYTASDASEPLSDTEQIPPDQQTPAPEILRTLQATPASADQLKELCDNDITQTLYYLGCMELDGCITRMRDGRYFAKGSTG